MSVRTGEITHDVAWARPPAIPGVMIQGYNGAALASREQVDAWGKPFLMGFESATTRSYAGGDAGEADAAFSCGVYDSWGYPKDCGSWVCAADASSTPAQFLANITDYGRRYALRMIAGGRSGPIVAYGNPAAVEALCAGIRAAGLTALRWGVGTWGYGEGSGPDQPPAEADVELLQSGNTPGQADGTDLNWLYTDVAAFAALGGPSDASRPTLPPEEDEMYYRIYTANDAETPWFLTWIDPVLHTRVKTPIDNATANAWAAEQVFSGVPNLYASIDANGPHPYTTSKANLDLLPAPPAAASVSLTDAQIKKLGAAVTIDPAAIAKAVNDDAAARMAS